MSGVWTHVSSCFHGRTAGPIRGSYGRRVVGYDRGGTRLRSGSHEPRFIGDDDGLDSVTCPQLREHSPDVGLHGRLRHVQLRRDLLVRPAAGHEHEDLALAVGERIEHRGLGLLRIGQHAREVGDEPSGGGGGDDGLALVHGADRGEHLLGRGVFEEERRGADLDRLEHVFVEVEGREDDDLRGVPAGAAVRVRGRGECFGGGEAVHVRHPHVHEHDVDVVGAKQPDRLGAVAGFEHHFHVWLGVDHQGEPGADQLLVVDDRHADRAHNRKGYCRPGPLLGSGMWHRTRNPPPGLGPAARVPPSIAARSRMPTRPCPAPSDVAAAPRPSSSTEMVSPSVFHSVVTIAAASGPPCLRMFVSDSCTIRYSATPAPGGRARGAPRVTWETLRPAAFTWPMRASMSASAGWGMRSAVSPFSSRSTPRMRRISARAAREVSAMVSSARVAASGSAAAAYLPPSAWATTTDREWATISCISRAIRLRSATVAICACWSRSRSRRCARSRSDSRCSRRLRRSRPAPQASSTSIAASENSTPPTIALSIPPQIGAIEIVTREPPNRAVNSPTREAALLA